METFTLRAAAAACELSYQLVRKRADRGTLRTVKRDGIRLVPRAELERTGLWPGSRPALSGGQELQHLRDALAEASHELETLRPLPAQLDAERQARELAEAAAHEHQAAATIARAKLDAEPPARKKGGGLRSGIRALWPLPRPRRRPASAGAAFPPREEQQGR